MQSQQWRGRGMNLPVWIWLVPAALFWLEKFESLGAPLENGVPFLGVGFVLLLILWQTQRRFSLILDNNGLCYSSHGQHVHQSWASIRSVQLVRGKLLLETEQKVHRLELIGLSDEEAHKVLYCIRSQLPHTMRVVA